MPVVLVLAAVALVILVIWLKDQPPTEPSLDLHLESFPGQQATPLPSSESQYSQRDSIQEPRVDELEPREQGVEILRLAMKYSLPVAVRYLDKSRREVEAIVVQLREQGDFFVCDRDSEDDESIVSASDPDRSASVQTKWIQEATISLSEIDADQPTSRALVDDLLTGSHPQVRQEALFLATNLGGDVHLATLLKLTDDPDVRVREAVADATRQHTARIRKTVSRQTYTFLDLNQDCRIFGLLERLSKDGAPTVRTKAAYALGDHPGEKTAAILERLSLDPDEQVRRAADHAKGRLAEQAGIAAAYEAAVREKAASGGRKSSTSNAASTVGGDR